MDYRDALGFLDNHTNLEGGRAGRFEPAPPMPTAGQTGALSLDAMVELMAALGDPHQAFRSIHLTGTNGKGSTARMAAGILAGTGLSVGLYTSPNLSKVNERIVWDGRDITNEEFAEVVGLIAQVVPLLESTPSRFELLTAAAFVWFAEQGAEVAVVEVGLLGRFDATNVIDGDVAVITNIGKDHTDGADGWRHQVAAEKAGIIKPQSRVVLGSLMGELRTQFEAEESLSITEAVTDFDVETNSVAMGGRLIDLQTPWSRFEELFVPFHGSHQGWNAATAVVAVETFFGRSVEREVVDLALEQVILPGRFEVVAANPVVVLDGAHNPHGAQACAATLAEEFARTGSRILIVGMLVGKDPTEMLTALDANDFDAVICTQPDSNRAIPADVIAKAAEGLGITPEIVPDTIKAFERATSVANDQDLILVAGSLYVVGEIRTALVELATRLAEPGRP